MTTLSLAICTWNRSRILDETLRRVAALALLPGGSWEVLVVDNNSPDDTHRVIQAHRDRLPIRYIHEPRQGVAHARNAAVAVAAGDLFVFLDDDCRPEPSLLTEYWEASQANPDAVVFGGTIEPEFEVNPPGWVTNNLDLLSCVYGRLSRPGPNRWLEPHESVFSGNMAVRTTILKRYPFNTTLGRVGTGRVGGEEIDFYVRLRADGYAGYWVGTAVARHYIPARVMTLDYIRRTFVGEGRLDVRMYRSHSTNGCPLLFGLPRWALRQYARSAALKYLLWPLRSRRWVEAYTRCARMNGLLRESWHIRTAHPTSA